MCGVAVDSLKDMEILFHKVPLDKITTSMTINAPAAILLAMYIAVSEQQGVSAKRIGGTIQNDILKEYIAQHSWIFPPDPSMRIITDILAYCADHVPKWNTISISGYHIREAGSTAVQELAFTIADGIAYVRAGMEAGIPVDKFAPRLSFFFNAHMDFFEEIAKYRAARRMWARIMRERFQAKDENSWKLRFHTQTAGVTLTAQQPINNVVRVALQGLMAVLGGTQSLHTNSMDETLALPTEHAATIALRTQQVIGEEAGVANSIDPLGGSFFLEKLTNEMEEKALNYIQKIDEMGGMVKAVKRGYPQREIADAAFHSQRLGGGREGEDSGKNAGNGEREKTGAQGAHPGRQAGAGRSRPGSEDHRPGVAGRRVRGHLHRPPPDPGDDRERRGTGGRRRDRAFAPLRRAQFPSAADRGDAPRKEDERRRGLRRRDHPGRRHPEAQEKGGRPEVHARDDAPGDRQLRTRTGQTQEIESIPIRRGDRKTCLYGILGGQPGAD